MYPDPDDFKPERFFNPDGSLRNDPVLASGFGFGRRICPGRHFVDATVFILVASLLSVFNFEKQKGTDGGADTFPYTGSGTRYGHRGDGRTQKADHGYFSFSVVHYLSA